MKYFTINELTKSATATRMGIDNTPSQEVKNNLTALVDNILDPLRKAWGKPIRVSSGYRCPALNKAVKGSTSSQHMKGEAADITSINDSFADNAKLLKLLLASGLKFDQVICEEPNAKGEPSWIHVSYKRFGANRGQKLTCRKGKYYSGINL